MDSTTNVMWVRLDTARPELRLVATSFPSGSRKLLLLGDDVLAPPELDGLARFGFYRSPRGLLLRDSVRFGLEALQAVFPTARPAQMPSHLVMRTLPRRARATDPVDSGALRANNLIGAVRELGANGAGEAVFEGEDGRYVVRDRAVVAREGDPAERGNPARFLRGATPEDMARCADGFVGEIRRGKPQRFADLKRWCAIVTGAPEEGIETAPLLRVWQEAVEAALVRALHQGVPLADLAAFEQARRLEDGQPAFLARTGNSIVHQQYSTPLPISVAVQYIMGDQTGAAVLEPTIGNGSLVSLLRGARICAVDIDPARVATIRRDRPDIAVEYGDVLSLPVRAPTADGRFDTIVCNPPFGGLKRPVMMGPLKVSRLDHQILIASLQKRTEDGLAVYIVGGDSAIDSKAGEVRGGSRYLFNWLADHYQVDVVEVDGGLYAKQGSGFPIRIVVVGRRGANAAPIPDTLPVIDDHEALIDWARRMRERYAPSDRDALQFDAAALATAADAPGAEGSDDAFDAAALVLPDEPQVADRADHDEKTDAAASADPDLTYRRSDDLFTLFLPNTPHGENAWRELAAQTDGTGKVLTIHVEETIRQLRAAGYSVSKESAAPSMDAGALVAALEERPAQTEVASANPATSSSFVAALAPAAANVTAIDENSYQSPYIAQSKVGEASAMIPRNLQTATRHALEEIVERHGDIDAFVAARLGWAVDEMHENEYLSPEQVDAVAMMIHAQERGRACLEADQTGLGKGRTMAAMARYAALKGRTTVFLTETPTLFTDFWRDLQDIGSDHLFTPMIVNEGVPVYDPKTGETLVSATPKAVIQRALAEDVVPPAYNLVLATYSQFNRAPASSAKARWIGGATRGAQLLLDESHNAAGDSNTSRNVAVAIGNADGVAYSSATSMKAAKNVLIYAALFPESVDVAGLPETLQAGGEVLLEVLSGMMARDGVFIRREHDLSALRFNQVEGVATKERNIDLSDKLSEILELMSLAAGDLNALVSERNKEIHRLLENMSDSERAGNRMGAVSMNFGSRLFAIYRQFQMAIKIDLAVDRCVAALEAGKKPVVVMENTMESLLRDLVFDHRDDPDMDDVDVIGTGLALQAGSTDLPRGLTFRDVLSRMLHRLRYYSETSGYGEVRKVMVSSEGMLKTLANIESLIDEFPDLPCSPLDEIRRRVEAAGYTMDELSGRSLRIDERTDPMTGLVTPTVTLQRERPKAQIVRGFNSGETDALLLTGAGSTGISLHASEKFEDQRQRVLVELQSAADVNKRTQFFGRVNRKGQVSAPEIETLSSGLIGEARPIAMQNAKLRKLSANTTANQDSAALDRNVPDFINEVGDLVARRYLESNPSIAHRLDITIDLEDAESGFGRQEAYFITKLTSRLVMLRNAEQEAIYEEITAEYQRIIKELDEKGLNPFKSKELDLKAREVSCAVYEGGNPASGSVFEHPVYLKTVQYSEEVLPLRRSDVEARMDASRERYQVAYRQAPGVVFDRLAKSIERLRPAVLKSAMQGRKDTLEEALAAKDPNAVQRLNQRVDFIIETLPQCVPGAPVTFSGAENAKTLGVIVDVALPSNEQKLVNPGQYLVQIAVPGQSKLVERSLYGLMEDDQLLLMPAGIPAPKLWDAFDAAPAGWVTRQRCVLDGNLFKAAQLAASHKIGSCVMYTDEQGARHRGVLLHAGVKPQHLQELKVRVATPALAAQLMAAMPDLVLTSAVEADWETVRDVVIRRDGPLHKITVPGTKTHGGRYFGDPDLCGVTGEFAGTRAFMTARFAPDKLEAVVRRLGQLGVALYAPPEAREKINQLLLESPLYNNENGDNPSLTAAA